MQGFVFFQCLNLLDKCDRLCADIRDHLANGFNHAIPVTIPLLHRKSSRRRFGRAQRRLIEVGKCTHFVFEDNLLCILSYADATFKEILNFYARLIDRNVNNLIFYFLKSENRIRITNDLCRGQDEFCIIQCIEYPKYLLYPQSCLKSAVSSTLPQCLVFSI